MNHKIESKSMTLCFDEHNARKVLDKYIKQTPEENIKMFEEMDKERKHGTWFYPLLWHEKDIIRKKLI